MQFAQIRHYLVAGAVFVAITTQSAPAADNWPRIRQFTNETAIANGHLVISAVRSGDDKSKASIQALIGSQIVIAGGGQVGQGANLTVSSNIVVDIEILPMRGVIPQAAGWTAEVLGTLKRVDFKKRVIYMQAKPEDWRVDAAL